MADLAEAIKNLPCASPFEVRTNEAAYRTGHYDARQAAAEIVSTSRAELQAVYQFLMGESPLEGVQFGEKHPTKAGVYWWRLNLRAALVKG